MTDPRGNLWSDHQLTILLTHYGPRGAEYCARKTHRTPLAVRLKAHRMGLKRRPVLGVSEALTAFVASRESVSGKAA